jgi:vacuolar-type H+-ATPase subunit H
MELIKQIKDAESKAKKLIEEAEKDAVQAAEALKKEQISKLELVKKQRSEAIENATAQGRAAGQQEANKLASEAAQQQQGLKNTASGRKDSASWKIVDFLRNQIAQKNNDKSRNG